MPNSSSAKKAKAASPNPPPAWGGDSAGFRALIEHAQDVIMVLSAEGQVKYCSPATKTMLGLEPREMMNKMGFEMIHPDDLPIIIAAHQKGLENPGIPIKVPCYRIRHADGNWRHIEATGTNLLHQPAVSGVVINLREITDRVRAEEALRTAEARWRLMFEQSPLSMQVFSPEGLTLQVSAAWEKLFGASLDSVRRHNILSDPQLEATGSLSLMRKAFQGEIVHVPPAPFVAAKVNGALTSETRWIGGLLFPLLDEKKQVREVICIHEDITEQKLATVKMERSEAITRAINAFATSLIEQHTEEEILWEVTRQCIASLGFADCVIYLLDPERGLLTQRAAYGPKNPRGHEIRAPLEIPLGSGIVGSVAVTGRAEIIPDTSLDPRYIVDDTARLSEITVPIVSEGTVIGVIDSEHPEANFFTEDHLDILKAIAFICANKLVRARAERQLRDLNKDLERRIAERTAELVAANDHLKKEIAERTRAEKVQKALYQISEAIHTTEDLDSLYRRIHAIIAGLMPAANFYIALEDSATGYVSFPYYIDEILPEAPEPRKGVRGLTEYVLRAGKTLLATRGDLQDLFDRGECELLGAWSHVWLGVPLSGGSRTFGVMAVQDHRSERAFGEEHKQILSFVAEQTALAIERKRSEAALRESAKQLSLSEERFSKAFHATPSILAISRIADGCFIDVNEAFLDTIALPRDQVIGRNAKDLGLWETTSQRQSFLREVGTSNLHNKERRFVINGQARTYLHSAEMISIANTPCLLTAAMDITERKQAEIKLLKALAHEREVRELKTQFVSAISHEFRTPLGIILSSSNLLDRYYDRLSEKERREQLDSIQQCAHRMAGMMEEVLLSAKSEAGQLEFSPAPLELASLCARLGEEITAAMARRCPVRFETREPRFDFQGDENLLRHLLSNLLTNAVKYSPEGTPVLFTLAREADEAVLVIADQGVGIPASDHSRLFKAFQRGENVHHLPGTGLGLVIVKRCVDLHGGQISFVSAEGKGTAVTVRLPIRSPVPKSARKRRAKS